MISSAPVSFASSITALVISRARSAFLTGAFLFPRSIPQLSKSAQVQRGAKLEEKLLPADMDYTKIPGLRIEAAEKLNEIKPANIGQASRISGVNPADINVLLIRMNTKKQ